MTQSETLVFMRVRRFWSTCAPGASRDASWWGPRIHNGAVADRRDPAMSRAAARGPAGRGDQGSTGRFDHPRAAGGASVKSAGSTGPFTSTDFHGGRARPAPAGRPPAPPGRGSAVEPVAGEDRLER